MAPFTREWFVYPLAGGSTVSGPDESLIRYGMDRGCRLARRAPRAADPLIQHPFTPSPRSQSVREITRCWTAETVDPGLAIRAHPASHPLTIRVDRLGRTALVPGQHVRSFDPNRLQLFRVQPEQFQDGGRDLSRLDRRIDGA